MRLLIIYLFFFNLNARAQVSALDPNTVNKYVFAALNINIPNENGTKKIQCSFPVIQTHLRISASNREQATTLLILQCIKEQCETLGAKVDKATEELQALPDQEFINFLEFSGRNADEITRIIESRKSNHERVKLNCNNSQPFRNTAYDLCFSLPITCSKN